MNIQKLLKPFLIAAVIVLILTAAFFAPEQTVQTAPMPTEAPHTEAAVEAPAAEEAVPEEPAAEAPAAEIPAVESVEEPVAEEPAVEESAAETAVIEVPEPEQAPPALPQCTVSVSCAELLSNMDLLAEEKHPLVPADGLLLPPVSISLSGGESVFDVVLSAVQANALHMEYSAGTGTAYIEGICNLYEFDAGPTSGWTYSVNGIFPNQDTGTYLVQSGDAVQLVYSLTPKTLQ